MIIIGWNNSSLSRIKNYVTLNSDKMKTKNAKEREREKNLCGNFFIIYYHLSLKVSEREKENEKH